MKTTECSEVVTLCHTMSHYHLADDSPPPRPKVTMASLPPIRKAGSNSRAMTHSLCFQCNWILLDSFFKAHRRDSEGKALLSIDLSIYLYIHTYIYIYQYYNFGLLKLYEWSQVISGDFYGHRGMAVPIILWVPRRRWPTPPDGVRPEEKFRLPDALETPRSQQAQHAREAGTPWDAHIIMMISISISTNIYIYMAIVWGKRCGKKKLDVMIGWINISFRICLADFSDAAMCFQRDSASTLSECQSLTLTISSPAVHRSKVIEIIEQAWKLSESMWWHESWSHVKPMKPMKPMKLPTCSNRLRPGGGTSPTVVPRWKTCQVTTGCGQGISAVKFTTGWWAVWESNILRVDSRFFNFLKDIEGHWRTLSDFFQSISEH